LIVSGRSGLLKDDATAGIAGVFMLAMLVVVTSMDSVEASRDWTETLRSAVSPMVSLEVDGDAAGK